MKWQVKPKAPSAFLKQFPEFSLLITQLLYNRGFKTQQQIDEFFNPDYETDLHDPFLLKDMDKAVKRINQAIKKQEKITVYGDFDADGVCASSVIYLTLQELGLKNLDIYIPDRAKENHGLNQEAIKKIAQGKTNLIITVDCASGDLAEVDLANSLGLDIIITDHHQLGHKLPKTIALINPWQKGDNYPFKELVGAGVAYKLACALLGSKKSFKKWLLDLVSIATVADVSPIIGENRTLVKYGLGVLAQTKWIGLQELMKIAKVVPEVAHSVKGQPPVTNLDCYTLGFVLGPRLNAAGRMNHADVAFKLLTTQNKKEAEELSQEVDQKNKARQSLTDKIVKQVIKCLEEKINQGQDFKLIFEGSPDWPVGLVGLVAGKSMDKYHRPAVVYHQKEDLIHASCRGIAEFDLMEMLNDSAQLFDDYGGHKFSAGFRAKVSNLDKIKDSLVKFAEKKLKNQDLSLVLKIDAQMFLEDINWLNYDQVQMFAPFGKKNSQPRFLAKELEICSLRSVGNGQKHLKMELAMFSNNKAKKFNAIAFGFGDKEEILKKGQLIDVVFELIVNQWNGRRDLEMKIIDLRLCK